MSNMPRRIFRNAGLWVDRNSWIGQAAELELPEFKIKSAKLRNFGMVRETAVNLGREGMAVKIKTTAFDPANLALFGLKIGTQTPLLATAMHVDEDGTEHSSVVTMQGKLFELKLAGWKPGDKPLEDDYTFECDYLKLEIDGSLILEETLWETGSIARGLMMA